MVSVNNTLLKQCFKLYDDTLSFTNYSKIAYKYYKYYKENKDKKSSQESQDKLKEDVKKWLFSQSLETRLKICTVENEFFGKILYQMIFHHKLDKTIVFKPKPLFYMNQENNEQFSKDIKENNFNKNENEINIPKNNNTKIKITKTNKDGKKTEAPKLGYSQASLENFSDEEIILNNFGNFFSFFSFRGSYSLAYDKNSLETKKIEENMKEDFLKNIIFFSVHHRHYPDCFTLSPEFLLEKEKFENIFLKFGNKNYFSSLIQSQLIQSYPNNSGNKSQKIYEYFLPDWFKGDKEDIDIQHTVTEYAIAFLEQAIMIKYLLNKHEKKIKIYSLINENTLNRFFSDRKIIII